MVRGTEGAPEGVRGVILGDGWEEDDLVGVGATVVPRVLEARGLKADSTLAEAEERAQGGVDRSVDVWVAEALDFDAEEVAD